MDRERRHSRLDPDGCDADTRATMTRALYFDAFSGVSGDMTVGALLALGVPFDLLREELAKIDVGEAYEIAATARDVGGIRAVKFDVVLSSGEAADRQSGAAGHHHEHGGSPEHHHHHGHDHGEADHQHVRFAEVRSRIAGSRLPSAVAATAISIFTKLAIAEGRIHGIQPEEVSFHEVGAVDSIVDIVGAAIGLHHLGVEAVYCSSLPLGSGFVHCRHGAMPVPAPATAELLRGFAVRIGDGQGEMVTPTGAAIVAALAEPGPVPGDLRVDRVGYGAGTRVLADRPNLLRLVLGDVESAAAAAQLVVVEANIDDSNPEIFEHVMELLFAAGARDVWLQPVVMKKSRPAVVLSVLCDDGLRDVVAGIVLRETSTIGLRHHPVRRTEAPRSVKVVSTALGDVPVKISRAPDGTVNVAPEFEACRKIARERGIALKEVYAAAIAAAYGVRNED